MLEDKNISVDEILGQDEFPAIGVDDKGDIISINGCFERTYGWRRADLEGKPLTTIIPPSMRESHLVGFSRFLITEKPRLLGRKLQLPILYKGGSERTVEHYITADRRGKTWRLAALIRP